jgi:predicted amidophosphoribosyltransferase
MLPICSKCSREFEELEKCEFCGKLFCHEDYPTHMGFERRHEGIAGEEGKLWRKRRDTPE